ncbi:Mitogen-activated protein kinase sma-5 [Caenorhabditis elegans]|uniref:Mitogen-activated protein kinase sma-5 n=3 Tax=Caenorhabditis elegans TaxID=6239 RepID=SMA5_CAEEL|nr:Mitogen-activated protein kinase sma-5 [Caenorhabditis elegans]G5EBT1.1 RecName: Full=Mitogen-activated protein kinase sma-5 [Caenorhabditis elegans]CAJ55250.1 Mitogen-activated protein kinase sma-5 [Caenorhabditis elegans]|eukprot:NP_001041297.1 Mitogen-activated protein kinase sma-5 [Caenorhabditis elegans]
MVFADFLEKIKSLFAKTKDPITSMSPPQENRSPKAEYLNNFFNTNPTNGKSRGSQEAPRKPLGQTNLNVQGSMPAKKEGFNRVLDGLKKRQLQHDFKLERAAETYEPTQNIGSGAFGIVCEAVETSSNQKVAIKKVAHASATPTLARRTLREIRVLRYINHPNIVPLRDIFRTKGPLGIDVFLVMDLMQNNLHHIIYGNEDPLEEHYINAFLGQLLRGLEYLHAACIAHRDLKPSNLLVNQDGTLRIADFGMAKCADNSSKKHDDEEHCYYMTQHVATLPYRAPELLFVLPEHSTAVDMWAVGCIFGEMVIRNEILPGRSVQGQIKMLLTMLGQPPQEVINEVRCDRTRKLIQDFGRKADAEWDDIMFCKARGDDQIVRGNCDTIDFVKQLFQYDAQKRINIQDALLHPYIQRVIPAEAPQKKCPFRVKKDMMQVEDLNHQELISMMKQDVRSAENPITYSELHSGDSTGSTSDMSTNTSGEYSPIAQHEQLLEDVATQISICEPTCDL